MKWFRLHSEFSTDPKVQSMPEAMQRRLIMIYCLHSSEEYETLSDEEIAYALSIDIETLHETFHLFQMKRFLDENNRINNWDKRQYKGDNSTERVKKFREKQTLKKKKRRETVSETPPDSDSDSDTESKKKEKINKKEKITLEQLSIIHIEKWLIAKRANEKYLTVDESGHLEYFKNYCVANGRDTGKKKYTDFIRAFQNSFEWENVVKKGNGHATDSTELTYQERMQAAGDSAVNEIMAEYEEKSGTTASADNSKL